MYMATCMYVYMHTLWYIYVCMYTYVDRQPHCNSQLASSYLIVGIDAKQLGVEGVCVKFFCSIATICTGRMGSYLHKNYEVWPLGVRYVPILRTSHHLYLSGSKAQRKQHRRKRLQETASGGTIVQLPSSYLPDFLVCSDVAVQKPRTQSYGIYMGQLHLQDLITSITLQEGKVKLLFIAIYNSCFNSRTRDTKQLSCSQPAANVPQTEQEMWGCRKSDCNYTHINVL